jgi:magnesium-transporting ATPase (P-type)
VELTEIDRQTIHSQNARLATQGLRVLGFAYRYFPHLPEADKAESELRGRCDAKTAISAE